MILSSSILKQRPYRYFLLLYDFIHRNTFELAHSGEVVSFDYMGNATKFFTPTQFTTYHDVYNAITWMKASEFYFKHDINVYSLININMPHEYEHGSRSEFYHVFTGIGVLAKLLSGKDIKKEDILNSLNLIGEREISVSKDKKIQMDVNINQKTLDVIKNPMFRPLLVDELRYAVKYVNSKLVSENLSKLIDADKYKSKLVIGENRGITTNDIKLFESVKGNFREIKLDHRI